jgi:hypothetical protein
MAMSLAITLAAMFFAAWYKELVIRHLAILAELPASKKGAAIAGRLPEHGVVLLAALAGGCGGGEGQSGGDGEKG